MFKKLSFVFIALIIFTACTKTSDLQMLYNPVKGIETGAWQMALIVEATTNFSSLIFDKTEAKFDTFTVRAFQVLPDGCTYFIVPAIYTDVHNNKTYDDTYTNIMASYLRLNRYGKVTDVLAEADFIITVDVRESPQVFHGTNSSVISITIAEADETPVFYARTAVKSTSDSNFYYRASKSARPVTYLTLKGFERIFYEGLPQAFS